MQKINGFLKFSFCTFQFLNESIIKLSRIDDMNILRNSTLDGFVNVERFFGKQIFVIFLVLQAICNGVQKGLK